MVNPSWGTKRICQNCAAKFYDLQREPIVCPKCHTEYDPEAFLKTRRSRPPAGADKEVAPVAVAGAQIDPEADDVEVPEDEDATPAGEGGEDEEEDLIEDASELGEDEDDMAEVIENVDEEEER